MISRSAAAAAVLLVAVAVSGCNDHHSESKAGAPVKTTKGKVRAAVPEAAAAGPKTPANADAGKQVQLAKSPKQVPPPARRQVSTLDVKPKAQRLRAEQAPRATERPGKDSDYERFVRAVIPLIDDYWKGETAKLSPSAQYTEPGGLVEYDGAAAPGCFGSRSADMSHNAYYCPVVEAPDACRTPASNRRYCLGGDIIAWDRSGLLLPFYRQIGDLAAALVLAHEWGHLIQARVFPQYAYTTTIRNELQADCYSGAWAQEMQRQGRVDIGAFNETLGLFQTVGGGDTAWLDPNSHGTQFQRLRAFTEGFEDGAPGCVGDQFDAVLEHVGLGKES